MQKRQVEERLDAMRPVALLLALLAVQEVTLMGGAAGPAGSAARADAYTVVFLLGYLAVALVVLAMEQFRWFNKFRFPPELDAIGLAIFIALTPSLGPFWIFYLFAVFALAAGGRRNSLSVYQSRAGNLLTNDAGLLSAGAALATVVRAAWLVPDSTQPALTGRGVAAWALVAAATYMGGLSAAWLGTREHTLEGKERFVEMLLGMVRVEKGLAESVRMVLSELAREFEGERALLVICDEEVERLFTWTADQDRRHVIAPEVLPLGKAGAYLAEDLERIVCWNSLDGAGNGFGWHRTTGVALGTMESPAATVQQELKARSVMAVTVMSAGHPGGRMLLVNGRRGFSPGDLRWFERVARHLNAPLENVFQLRNLRTRAVEAERSRISRDLHDGILQTLMSLNIQLGVLGRKATNAPEAASQDLALLQKTVKQEGEELRQMVKDLRPLRVESADLREMMYGFAERYHNESGLVVDLFLEENDLRAPDRICREVFQIYRESLNNIKKHAHASHVVVKLWQDDTKVFLVVDDNGQGFSFSGRFTSEELDRLRLGPISIKERTRTVGGILTVESNPGHGARLTVEIPLN
ncbi:MAG TPA: sensor histidine kinase [Candidatus Acidoferrales bacterium]|nr:sensor histidine kinase [Candidatus Acidoferrales bacterium]